MTIAHADASASQAAGSGQQGAAAYFKNLVWSTEEPGSPPADNNRLHLPQKSPFAGILGLKPANTSRMDTCVQAEPKRAPTAEGMDLHEYAVHQQNQQLEPVADDSMKDDAENAVADVEETVDSPETADDESEWAEADDEVLDTISDMMSKAWHESPLPPPLGPSAKSKPRSMLRSTRPWTSSGDHNNGMMPSWLKKPWQGPALLKRSKSNRKSSKPYGLRFAESVLGEDLVAAVELVHKDILENPEGDPLPEATIKFFIKAGMRVATTWAHSNLNRMFAAFGAYVAATCGVMYYTKRAVKWLAWRLPWCGKKVAGPAVTFTADELLPTAFFGPWLATYAVLRIIITERNKALAVAKEAEAAQDAHKGGAPQQGAAAAAREAPAAHADGADRQQKPSAAAGAEEVDPVQKKPQQQQQQPRPVRRRLLQRGGSVRLRSRQLRMSPQPVAQPSSG